MQSWKKPDLVTLGVVAVCVVVGILVPVLEWNTPVGAAIGFGALSFVLCCGLFAFTRRSYWTMVFIVVLIGGLVLLSRFTPQLGSAGSSWFLLGVAGGVLGGQLRGTGSAAGSSALRVHWRAGKCEQSDETARISTLMEHVANLDGERFTLVSAERGSTRFDVVGDASGAVMVFHTANVADESAWGMVQTPKLTGEVTVKVGERRASVPRRDTTTIANALLAARTFADTGARASELTWLSGVDVPAHRPLSVRSR